MILAAWYHPILATLFAFFALLLMGVILLQRGRGVGLAGAFGGAGGQAVFGSKTGDVLTWATIVIAIIFMTAAVLLNYVFVPPPPDLGPLPPVVEAAPAPVEPSVDQSTPPVEAAPTPAAPSSSPTGSWAPPTDCPQFAAAILFGEGA